MEEYKDLNYFAEKEQGGMKYYQKKIYIYNNKVKK